jgi:SAM-dependent methyltransferase
MSTTVKQVPVSSAGRQAETIAHRLEAGAGLRAAAKNLYSEVEPWTGALFGFETWSLTDNPNTVAAGAGVETAADWSNTRRKGRAAFGTDGTSLDNDDNYIRYILGVESINLIGLLALNRMVDLGRYRSIFEIGCGDMAQAYAIHRLFPGTKYVATDLDPYVIESCSRLHSLDGIEKRVLNVLAFSDEEIPFEGFDLLMSWGMEYALDDAQLLRLFQMVERTGVPYLMCSASTIGVMEYARFWMRLGKIKRAVDLRQLRMTGWRRSVGRFRALARRARLDCQVLGRFGYHFCMLLKRA